MQMTMEFGRGMTAERAVGVQPLVMPPWRYVAEDGTPPPGLYMVACSSTGASGLFVMRRQMRRARDWESDWVPHRNSTVTYYAWREVTPEERAAYEACYWGPYDKPAPPPLRAA